MALMHSPLITYNIQPHQASRLQSKAPVMPATMQELLYFLERLVAFCNEVLGGPTITAQQAHHIHQALTRDGKFQTYGQNADYLRYKLKEIVFTLYQTACEEFTHVCSLEEFMAYAPQFYDDPNWATMARHVVAPTLSLIHI